MFYTSEKLPLSEAGRNLMSKMIQLNFEDTKNVVFKDVRVSRAFFRSVIRITELHKSKVLSEKIINGLQEIFSGFFGKDIYPRDLTGDLCFQHTQSYNFPFTDRIVFFRIMPRRVAIYERQIDNNDVKNETG